MNQSPQQLELKYLAHYLAYGLKIELKRKIYPRRTEIVELSVDNIQFGNFPNKYGIKPLLIPLSEITSEEFESFGYKNTGWYVKGIIKNHLLGYKHFEYLISKHYDVFGLIDAGLALNKMDFIK